MPPFFFATVRIGWNALTGGEMTLNAATEPTYSYDSASRSQSRADTVVLLTIAAVTVLFHLFTNGRYGFHRDELQVLSDARHMDWGFVPYPPVTPFLERIGLELFGGYFRCWRRR